jgi:platelet-activating factor acetylhydrolase IB subunit alpha
MNVSFNVTKLIFNNFPIYQGYGIVEKLHNRTLLRLLLEVVNTEISIKAFSSNIFLEIQKEPILCTTLLSSTVLATTYINHRIKIFSLITMKVKRILSGHHNRVLVLLGLSGGILVSGSKDTSMRVWDSRQDWKCIKILPNHNSEVENLIRTGDNKFISSSKDFNFIIWDVESFTALVSAKEFNTILNISGLTSNRFAVACWDGNVNIYNVNALTGSDNSSFQSIALKHTAYVCKVIQLKNGLIVTGSGDGFITLWDDSTYNFFKQIKAHNSPIYCLLEVNRLLLSGSGDTFIKIWSRKDYSCVKVLSNHRFYIVNLFKLRDSRFVSFSFDSTVKIWEISSTKVVYNIDEELSYSNLIELKDGRLIVTGKNNIKIIS